MVRDKRYVSFQDLDDAGRKQMLLRDEWKTKQTSNDLQYRKKTENSYLYNYREILQLFPNSKGKRLIG